MGLNNRVKPPEQSEGKEKNEEFLRGHSEGVPGRSIKTQRAGPGTRGIKLLWGHPRPSHVVRGGRKNTKGHASTRTPKSGRRGGKNKAGVLK